MGAGSCLTRLGPTQSCDTLGVRVRRARNPCLRLSSGASRTHARINAPSRAAPDVICGRFLGFAQTGSGGFAGLLLLVETPDNIELVDATHVQQVLLPGPQYGWAYGGAVGLALDAALVLAASQMNFGSDGAGWQF